MRKMRALLALACAFSLGVAQVRADSIGVSPAGISPDVANTWSAVQTFNANITLGASNNLNWTGRSRISSAADGQILLANGAATTFDALQLGGVTASFPAIRRNAAGVDITVANSASTYATIHAANFLNEAAGSFVWSTSSRFTAPSDGVIKLSNNGQTDFTRLQLGGTTASFPSFKRNATGVDVRLADDSAFAPLASAGLTVNGKILTASTAPALTSCGTTPTITGSDVAGTVTEGTVATGCTITFNVAYAAAPHCTVTSRGGLGFTYTISTTALTITNVGALSSTLLDYICVGG